MTYYYSSVAGEMRLNGAVNGVVGSITLDTVVGLPGTTPFKLTIDPGVSAEEIVNVTAVNGNILTVERGHDGTAGTAHANSAAVRHMVTAEDLRLSREHEDTLSGAHGTSSALVGVSDTQTLTNKTFQATTTETPLKVRQQGASTANLFEVMTSGGSLRARWTALGLFLQNATQDVIQMHVGGDPDSTVLQVFPPAAGADAIRPDMPAGSTAKAMRVSRGGVETASIAADGNAALKATTVTTLNATGDIVTTGKVVGDTVEAQDVTLSGVSYAVTMNATNLNGNITTVSGHLAAPGFYRGSVHGALTPGTPSGDITTKYFSLAPQVTGSGDGGINVNWPGGAFPNGLVTFVVECINPAGWRTNHISASCNKTSWNGYITTDAGARAAQGSTVLLTGYAIGW